MKRSYIIAIASVSVLIVLAVILGVVLTPNEEQTPYDYLKNDATAPTEAFVPTELLLMQKITDDADDYFVFYENSMGNAVCALVKKTSRSYEVLAYGAPLSPSGEDTHRRITFLGAEDTTVLSWGIVSDAAVTGVTLDDKECTLADAMGKDYRIWWCWGAEKTATPEYMK